VIEDKYNVACGVAGRRRSLRAAGVAVDLREMVKER
jgi:hypothetical protein